MSPSIRELAQRAIHANKEHQYALKVYTEKLEAELETVDKLLDSANMANLDDEPELDVGGVVFIPGSVRAAAPIPPKELLSSDSLFYNDALRRTRYLNSTEVHPMRASELETLREAVRTENYRKHALDAQRRGLPGFSDLSDQPLNYLELNTESLDWDRIAEKVSTVSMTNRTARECEIRWLGDLHPRFNHEPWTQEEISKLKAMLAQTNDSQPDWVDIAKRLSTNRTPLDCMRHGTTRKLHVWTMESDERLLKAVRMYGHNNWSLVARYVSEDATASQCSNRYQRTLDPDVRHANWTVEEDNRLCVAVAAYGPSWVDIAAVLPGRHNDQCREHWNEQVNPAINKGSWTEEEDRKLLEFVRASDTPNWKEISGHLNTGRTENMCRSRYATLHRSPNKVPQVTTFSIYQRTGPQTTEASHDATTSQPPTPTPSRESTLGKTATSLRFLDPVVGANPALHKPILRRTQPINSKNVISSSLSTGRNKTQVQEIASSSRRSDTSGGNTTQSDVAMSAPPRLESSQSVHPSKKRRTTSTRPRIQKPKIGESVLRFDSVVSSYSAAARSSNVWIQDGAQVPRAAPTSTHPSPLVHAQGTSPTERQVDEMSTGD